MTEGIKSIEEWVGVKTSIFVSLGDCSYLKHNENRLPLLTKETSKLSYESKSYEVSWGKINK